MGFLRGVWWDLVPPGSPAGLFCSPVEVHVLRALVGEGHVQGLGPAPWRQLEAEPPRLGLFKDRAPELAPDVIRVGALDVDIDRGAGDDPAGVGVRLDASDLPLDPDVDLYLSGQLFPPCAGVRALAPTALPALFRGHLCKVTVDAESIGEGGQPGGYVFCAAWRTQELLPVLLGWAVAV